MRLDRGETAKEQRAEEMGINACDGARGARGIRCSSSWSAEIALSRSLSLSRTMIRGKPHRVWPARWHPGMLIWLTRRWSGTIGKVLPRRQHERESGQFLSCSATALKHSVVSTIDAATSGWRSLIMGRLSAHEAQWAGSLVRTALLKPRPPSATQSHKLGEMSNNRHKQHDILSSCEVA